MVSAFIEVMLILIAAGLTVLALGLAGTIVLFLATWYLLYLIFVKGDKDEL